MPIDDFQKVKKEIFADVTPTGWLGVKCKFILFELLNICEIFSKTSSGEVVKDGSGPPEERH